MLPGCPVKKNWGDRPKMTQVGLHMIVKGIMLPSDVRIGTYLTAEEMIVGLSYMATDYGVQGPLFARGDARSAHATSMIEDLGGFGAVL